MVVKINRAPVLTLWAAIVAERLGFDEDEALTLGKALAGYTAQSKGQRLGIYHPPPGEESEEKGEAPPDLVFVNLMGRSLPALMTPDGVRAAEKGKPSDPAKVRVYLQKKFGDGLAPTRKVMRALALSFPPSHLEAEAYSLYERFRPPVEKGKAGWGSEGELDLDKIARLARPT
ncbi:MAG TPA: hypothetical protein VK449_05990 [Anaerolineales bacterium]|nr:hypothetical protein [Anaerolineales bacterium]